MGLVWTKARPTVADGACEAWLMWSPIGREIILTEIRGGSAYSDSWSGGSKAIPLAEFDGCSWAGPIVVPPEARETA